MHLLLFNILLAILLTLLKVVDWRLTRAILLAGGRELIPLTRWLIARLGLDGGLQAEVALYALAGAYFVWSGATGFLGCTPSLALAALLALDALLVWVVIHNWRQLRA